MTRRCAFCRAKTGVTPVQALAATALRRVTHSPLSRVGVPPLCVAIRQGLRATTAVKAQIEVGAPA